jgi:M6 family metalloprotease-like protein
MLERIRGSKWFWPDWRLTCPGVAWFLVALAMTLPQSVKGDIVIQGKVVSAWPDSGEGAMPTSASRHSHASSVQSLPKTAAGAATPPHVGQYPSPKGTFYGLTIIVDFPDQPPAFNKENVEAWLNQKGFNLQGAKGSVRDYFLDISHGQFDFVNEVQGIYRAKQPKSYYDGGSGYERAAEFVKEVLDALDAQIDFSKFDNDKDGFTESISFMYAGTGKTWGQGLWPHAGGLNQKRDGVTLSRYMMTDMGDRYTLYVFCHETGHMIFGWPDLYGVGDYCLMANRMNDVNPVPVNDFYRADQGWIPLTDIVTTDNLKLSAIAGGGGFRFLNPANSKECFFWSNVKNAGRWSHLKGKGLLLWHFDKGIARNNPPSTLSLAVVQADGKLDLNATQWPSPGSDAKDFFYQGHLAEFTSTTNPKPAWNNGQAAALRVHSIGPIADTMTFAVGTGTPVSIQVGSKSETGKAGRASRGFKSASQVEAKFTQNVQQYLGRKLKPKP